MTGLEPGTNYPNPRSYEETQGRVMPLEPHGSITFDLAIELLRGDAIEAERKRLGSAAPLIQRDPKAGWSRV